MEAKELMIGNFVSVYGKDQRVTQVAKDFIDTEDYGGARFDREIILPIELNEEWLIRFEFKKHNEYYFEKYNFKVEDCNLFFKFRVVKSEFESIEISNFKYVHELQNIYFSLTKRELKIVEE